jgi:hypothetical protein
MVMPSNFGSGPAGIDSEQISQIAEGRTHVQAQALELDVDQLEHVQLIATLFQSPTGSAVLYFLCLQSARSIHPPDQHLYKIVRYGSLVPLPKSAVVTWSFRRI